MSVVQSNATPYTCIGIAKCRWMLPQAKKAGEMGDADFLRLAAEEAEFKRAKERLTLKHRNTSQWARRALKRGINVTDEGVLRTSTKVLFRSSC